MRRRQPPDGDLSRPPARAGHTHPEPTIVTTVKWTRWKIPFTEFTNSGVNRARVRTLYLGLGERQNPAWGGKGLICADDIRVSKP